MFLSKAAFTLYSSANCSNFFRNSLPIAQSASRYIYNKTNGGRFPLLPHQKLYFSFGCPVEAKDVKTMGQKVLKLAIQT